MSQTTTTDCTMKRTGQKVIACDSAAEFKLELPLGRAKETNLYLELIQLSSGTFRLKNPSECELLTASLLKPASEQEGLTKCSSNAANPNQRTYTDKNSMFSNDLHKNLQGCLSSLSKNQWGSLGDYDLSEAETGLDKVTLDGYLAPENKKKVVSSLQDLNDNEPLISKLPSRKKNKSSESKKCNK
jgi:hypothetical protein